MTIGLIPAALLTVAVFGIFALLETFRQWLDGLEER